MHIRFWGEGDIKCKNSYQVFGVDYVDDDNADYVDVDNADYDDDDVENLLWSTMLCIAAHPDSSLPFRRRHLDNVVLLAGFSDSSTSVVWRNMKSFHIYGDFSESGGIFFFSIHSAKSANIILHSFVKSHQSLKMNNLSQFHCRRLLLCNK